MSDLINNLPLDKEPASIEDVKLAKTLARDKKDMISILKEGFIIALFSFLISTPIVSSILDKLPFLNSPYILALFKGFLSFVLFIVLKIYFK